MVWSGAVELWMPVTLLSTKAAASPSGSEDFGEVLLPLYAIRARNSMRLMPL